MDFSCKHTEKYVTKAEIEEYTKSNANKIQIVDTNKFESEMLGWTNTAKVCSKETIENIKILAKEIREKAEVFIVVGVGGSNQGAKAIENMLTGHETKGESPEIMYLATNISAAYYNKIISQIGERSVYIQVIAKNYKTLEPGLTFRLLRKHLENKYGKNEAAQRIITTPTINDGLHLISLQQNYRFLPLAESLGGRFSVFSSVGLLACAVAGIDIDELMAGVLAAEESYLKGGKIRQDAKQYAIIRNILLKKNYHIEVLAVFEPQFEAFGRWWRQLFGESEGKNFTGIFPSVCSYTEDLHSVGQYLQQGKRNIMETFVRIKNMPIDISVPIEDNFDDGFNYLNSKTLNRINEAAYEATLCAHSEGGVPCIVIEYDELNAYNVGELMYFYFVVCYYSAVLLEVDPFNQPGVENYKQEMFKILRQE